jgi:hypothetical protein
MLIISIVIEYNKNKIFNVKIKNKLSQNLSNFIKFN